MNVPTPSKATVITLTAALITGLSINGVFAAHANTSLKSIKVSNSSVNLRHVGHGESETAESESHTVHSEHHSR